MVALSSCDFKLGTAKLSEPLKIAQVASLIESMPPKGNGDAEQVASYLTEELVRQGHDVTLFASEDSTTAASLVPCCKEPLRSDPRVKDIIPYYMIMLDKVPQDGS